MENLNSWNQLWVDWLDDGFATGSKYLSVTTQEKIKYWHDQTIELGLTQDALRAETLLANTCTLKEKTHLFLQLAVHQDLMANALEINQLLVIIGEDDDIG